MKGIAQMKNLYQLYMDNGNQAGFKVRRGSWGQSSWARVVSVTQEQKTEGQLPGNEPYHGNTPVFIDFKGKGKVEKASCPGTYQWSIVD